MEGVMVWEDWWLSQASLALFPEHFCFPDSARLTLSSIVFDESALAS